MGTFMRFLVADWTFRGFSILDRGLQMGYLVFQPFDLGLIAFDSMLELVNPPDFILQLVRELGIAEEGLLVLSSQLAQFTLVRGLLCGFLLFLREICVD